MRARYATDCKVCDGPIQRGELVAPKGDGWQHVSCGGEE